jgi:capsular polysaccharide biosynthesis protein
VPYTDQAALLSDTQLLITMHGAGLTNAIFLPPRAAVIEIFPYRVFCPLYAKLVNLMGLNYLPLYSLVRYTHRISRGRGVRTS